MTVTEIVVQAQPSALEWIAAGATVASAAVIAWQAWLTRRSVQASEQATEVARASLTESQLSRIEDGFPRITVSTPKYVPDTQVWRLDTEGATLVSENDIFKLPRDADLELRVDHTFTVRNDGPGTVLPRITTWDGARGFQRIDPIRAGDEQVYSFQIIHTVADWVKLLKSDATAERGNDDATVHPKCGSVRVKYAGPRDSDVDEDHVVEVRGSALIAVENAQGDWRRAAEGEWGSTLTAAVLPATRTYWRSRSAHVKFDTQSIAIGDTAAS